MHVIWKYRLKLGENFVELPRDHKFLDAQLQDGRLTLWALVNPNSEFIDRDVLVIGTGIEMAEESFSFWARSYFATVQSGPFVWHIFDRGEV